jgi:mannobiose 2-epimerase
MKPDLFRLRSELETELKREILPFWPAFRDQASGGFPGLIRNDRSVDLAHDRGVVMHARFLWTYAAAYRLYNDSAYLATAQHALDYLYKTLFDQANGGFYWMVSADGVNRTERKVIYGQAFAIYGLSEWYRATGDRGALDHALYTFELMERHARDPIHGGYFDACSLDWKRVVTSALSDVDIACAKSMNTNLHVMEAYTTLLAALTERPVPDTTAASLVRASLQDLIGVHLDKIRISPAHFGLYFDADWTPIPAGLSYGHDIEGSWLLTEAAERAWGGTLPGRIREAALVMARRTVEILDRHGPGLIHEGPNGGAGHLDEERVWWVQAECLVGLLNAASLNPDQSFVDHAIGVWEYIKRHVKDTVNGKWFWSTLPDGSHADQPKGGLWKTSYHNGRACMESMHRIDLLTEHK